MIRRRLGRTNVTVGVLGFGCGQVGGLMVRGTPAEREQAVARAVELGVDYFDTAPLYGDGLSETHLGQALRAVGVDVRIGTKVRPEPGADITRQIHDSVEASLRRLGMERVDLMQLHTPIAAARTASALSAEEVLGEVVPALDALRRAGKIRFAGITALGETAVLRQVLRSGGVDTAQVVYNLLNPSAGVAVPPGFPGQDFGGLLDDATTRDIGVIVIRVLAAGALAGREGRHPIAAPRVDPIGTGPDYPTDLERARLFTPLVEAGYATSLTEAALRFAVSAPAVSTVLLGYSSLQHVEEAAAAVGRGPLPPAALARLAEVWGRLADRPAPTP